MQYSHIYYIHLYIYIIMNIIDITKQFASVNNVDNMILYVNLTMNLTKFMYLMLMAKMETRLTNIRYSNGP